MRWLHGAQTHRPSRLNEQRPSSLHVHSPHLVQRRIATCPQRHSPIVAPALTASASSPASHSAFLSAASPAASASSTRMASQGANACCVKSGEYQTTISPVHL